MHPEIPDRQNGAACVCTETTNFVETVCSGVLNVVNDAAIVTPGLFARNGLVGLRWFMFKGVV